MKYIWVFALLLGGVAGYILWSQGAPSEGSTSARLTAVSPRHVSNGTSYPLTVYGSNLRPGLRLKLTQDDSENAVELPTVFVDEGHLVARLPEGVEVPRQTSVAEWTAQLVGDGDQVEGTYPVYVVNDVDYVQPFDLEVDPTEERVFVASPPTDQVYVFAGEQVQILDVLDQPRALARYVDGEGLPWLVVLHEYAPELLLLRMDEPSVRRLIRVGAHGQGLAVNGSTAWISNRLSDGILRVDLESEEVSDPIPVGVDPLDVAVGSGRVFVGNAGSTDLSVVDPERRAEIHRIAPDPNSRIIGGHTAKYQAYVMSGSAPRDLAYSPTHERLFVADIGPVIGPNPDRMEVSMNGGIGIIDPATGRHLRHVSILRGVPEGLALDDSRGILYAADIATGRVVALRVTDLLNGDDAEAVQLASVDIMPPAGTRFIRDETEFSVDGRSSVALHSGPRQIRLRPDGARGWVLNRFTGVVTELDLTQVESGRIQVREVGRVPGMGLQIQRRLGEVTYFTDLGNSRMSCDACHYEGHSSGLLFTKGEPMHIYRTPTIRSVRESPPYFTPAQFPSLYFTAKFVLSRNRFHNPDASRTEVRALGLYQETVVQPPNPHRDAEGRWPDSMTLPDGTVGAPGKGLALFEGKGACVSCHPAPAFTTDQDEATRNALYDVGTEVTLPLRTDMQDAERYDLPAPSLVGLWGNFPLLHGGGAGYAVDEEGRALARDPFAIRRVFELGRASGEHGAMAELTPEEQRDLIAFLMTL